MNFKRGDKVRYIKHSPMWAYNLMATVLAAKSEGNWDGGVEIRFDKDLSEVSNSIQQGHCHESDIELVGNRHRINKLGDFPRKQVMWAGNDIY